VGERQALAEQRELSEEAQLQVTLLNRQLAALRTQLAQLSEALELSEQKNVEQEVQIADLGKRLNVALASKVQELARYRSEFFGRLREILGNRQDIRIVGDRFVFQSELLFASGSATVADEGRPQLARLASTLKGIAADIPGDLEWVLRVDGHTDRAPINTYAFPSNWELSTARAVSVVKFLIEQGIPAERLAATGFGEFQPLDTGGDEIAYRRNRRIEFKLTER
jgi:chemotaxis protein MotB